MKITFKLQAILVFCLTSCNSGNFERSTSTRGAGATTVGQVPPTPSSVPSGGPADPSNDSDNDNPGVDSDSDILVIGGGRGATPTPTPPPTSPTSPTPTPTPTPPPFGDLSKCWFMVSGGHFGWNSLGTESYGTTFPLPKDGGPIIGGKTFDNVGGIFLNARDNPYEASGELTLAIANTFDSIAVSPGVSIEVRNGSGGVLIPTRNGPYAAYSSDYTGRSATNKAQLASNFRAVASNMPTWMRNYFSQRPVPYELDTIPLHAARWVKVTKIPGVSCD